MELSVNLSKILMQTIYDREKFKNHNGGYVMAVQQERLDTLARLRSNNDESMIDTEADKNGDLFTDADVVAALQTCNFNKGLGLNRMDRSLLLHNEEILHEFAMDYARFLKRGENAQHLKQARNIPLSKRENSQFASLKEIRNIAISPHIFKIWSHTGFR